MILVFMYLIVTFFTANMALQQQQQPGVVLSGERPIMPVVSVSGVGVATSQMSQVQQSPMSAVQQLPLQVLNVLFLAIKFP